MEPHSSGSLMLINISSLLHWTRETVSRLLMQVQVPTLVFMFCENSRMVSTLVQASGWSLRLVRTSWATRCYKRATRQIL